jgi:DNA-directed RNA polymerase subunit M/transcription elongation factor TFIIS
MDQARFEAYRSLCAHGLDALQATRLEAHALEAAQKPGLFAGRIPVWTYASGATLFETDSPEIHMKEFLNAYADTVERLKAVLEVPELRARILAAADPVAAFAALEDHAIEPFTAYGAWQDAYLDQLKRSVEVLEASDGAEDSGSFIACPKCRSNSVDTEQKQTRSADEPMTVFCKCRKCGKRFVMN